MGYSRRGLKRVLNRVVLIFLGADWNLRNLKRHVLALAVDILISDFCPGRRPMGAPKTVAFAERGSEMLLDLIPPNDSIFFLLEPIIATWLLLRLDFICHCSSHLSVASSSFSSFLFACLALLTLAASEQTTVTMSSANWVMMVSLNMGEGWSLTYILNSTGPKLDPWGTPARGRKWGPSFPLKYGIIFLVTKNEFISAVNWMQLS